jgi:GTP-binding protein
MEVRFIKSSNDYKLCPKGDIPEFAFIGRSNVGKSSLINMITGVKNLAKVSSKPGKTKLINHFIVLPLSQSDKIKLHKKDIKPVVTDANSWYLVDLPGYGYARASKSDKEHFSELIKGYITKRSNLLCLFVLIDSRLGPQKLDIEFLTFLGQFRVPFVLIFTKTDKISSNKLESNFSNFKKAMLDDWEEMPGVFFTSTIEKKGKDELLGFIETTIKSGTKKVNW